MQLRVGKLSPRSVVHLSMKQIENGVPIFSAAQRAHGVHCGGAMRKQATRRKERALKPCHVLGPCL